MLENISPAQIEVRMVKRRLQECKDTAPHCVHSQVKLIPTQLLLLLSDKDMNEVCAKFQVLNS